ELRGRGFDHPLAQLARLAAVSVAAEAVENEVVPLQPHGAVPLAAAADLRLIAGIVRGERRHPEPAPELGRVREVLYERRGAVRRRDPRPERQEADGLLEPQV